MDTVKDAATFAAKVHGDQEYGPDLPYTYHLDQVCEIVKRFGGTTTHQIAAWLHDVVEDTPVKVIEVQTKFGSRIAQIVDLVSNRKPTKPVTPESKREAKRKTWNLTRCSKDAVFVKLCDRLANVTAGSKNDMYRGQHATFKSILYREGEFDELWKEIDQKLGWTDAT